MADDASFALRTQAEGTKMFGSVGHQVIVNPGTSIVTGPSDSSKQLHRPLGQRPAWRSECLPAAGRGWQSASQNGDASEQVLGAVLTYTVEYVNILTFTIPGVPYTLLHPAGKNCFLIPQVTGRPHPPATSPSQTVACPQEAPSRQTQFAGIPPARGPAASNLLFCCEVAASLAQAI